jgi:hypothetical protein
MIHDVLDSPYAVPAHLLLQQLPEQGLMFLNLNTEEYFGLDEVGTSMYEALLATGSVDAAADRLRGEYDVDRDRLQADLQKFVAALFERGLIVHATE